MLERWGRPVAGRAELAPGLHFVWPFPVDRVHRFQTERVQKFIVGSQPEDKKESANVILWNLAQDLPQPVVIGAGRPALVQILPGLDGRRVIFQYDDQTMEVWELGDSARLLRAITEPAQLAFVQDILTCGQLIDAVQKMEKELAPKLLLKL